MTVEFSRNGQKITIGSEVIVQLGDQIHLPENQENLNIKVQGDDLILTLDSGEVIIFRSAVPLLATNDFQIMLGSEQLIISGKGDAQQLIVRAAGSEDNLETAVSVLDTEADETTSLDETTEHDPSDEKPIVETAEADIDAQSNSESSEKFQSVIGASRFSVSAVMPEINNPADLIASQSTDSRRTSSTATISDASLPTPVPDIYPVTSIPDPLVILSSNGQVISGQAEAGAIISVFLVGANTAYAEATVDATGQWQIQFDTALEHQTQIQVVANINGQSVYAQQAVQIDAEALAPRVVLANDSGSSANDLLTNDGQLQLAGLEPGALVEYSLDGQSWSEQYQPQAGENQVYVRQTDISGNISPINSITFNLDQTAAPANLQIELITDSGVSLADQLTQSALLQVANQESNAEIQFSLTGNVGDWSSQQPDVNGALADGQHTIYVRQIDPAGNASTAQSIQITKDTNAAAPQLSATNGNLNVVAEDAATIEYRLPGGEWVNSFSPVEGENRVEVRQIDGAGNISAIQSITFVRDTIAPESNLNIQLENDSGNSSSDRISNNGQLNISGAEIDAEIQFSIDGATWSTEQPQNLDDGEHTIYVRQVDLAGNASVAQTVTFTLDSRAENNLNIELINDSGRFNSDLITNNGQLTVTGAEAGAEIQFSLNGTDWTTTQPDLADGQHTIFVRQVDVSGNPSDLQSITFTKDTAAPTAPEVVLVSNDLRVTAETGATIEYRLNGGEWIDSFTAVEGQNNVEIRQTDAAGNISEVTTQSFVKDTTLPTSNLNIQLVEGSGMGTADLITNNSQLNVIGAEAGATIEYSIDGIDWSTDQPQNLADGSHTVYVRQVDQAGNASQPQSISFIKDTTAANNLNIQLTEDTGSSSSDLITSQTELTVTGVEAGATVEYSADGLNWSVEQPQNLADGSQTIYVRQIDIAGNISEPQSIDITVDTTAPAAPSWDATGGELIVNNAAGSIVEYSTDNGVNWQASYSEVEGDNTLQIRTIDVAGNASNPIVVSFVRDTTAPNINLSIQLADDSGRSNSDLITNNSQLNVSGEEAGAEIQFSLNGTDWTTTQPDLADGQHTIFVRQVDVSGNPSDPQSITFTKDTAAPTAPEVVLVSNDLRVTAETGATVEYRLNGGEWIDSFTAVEGQNNVEIRQTDAAGNISEVTTQSFVKDTTLPTSNLNIQLVEGSGMGTADLITNNSQLNVIGAETGATIEYSIDGIDWSTDQPQNLADGSHTVYVRQVDQAGNASQPQSISFIKDTTAANNLNIQLTEDTGSSSSDLITSQTELTVTGVEAGATVEYSADGLNWSVEQPQNLADGSQTIYVRQVDVAGNISEPQSISFTKDTAAPTAPEVVLVSNDLQVTAETGATVEYRLNGGEWIDSFTAVEGQNNVEIRQTDAAGNISEVTTQSFVRDTTPPANNLNVELTEDTGSSSSDLITSQTELTVTGAEAGAEIQFSLNGTDWTTTQPDLADGQHTIFVRQVDVSGNPSDPQSITFTKDTAVPTAPEVVLVSNDLRVTAESGATVEYRLNGGEWIDSFTAVEGQNNVEIRQTDAAGNISEVTTQSFVKDTTLPTSNLNIQLVEGSGMGTADLITNNSQLNVIGAEAGATIEYSIDGIDWSTDQPQNLADGSHTVYVRQVDQAGNASQPQSISFIKDTTAANDLNIQLTEDTGSSSSDLITSQTELTVTGAEASAEIQFSLNGTDWTTTQLDLADGQHTIFVRQVDVSGNPSDPQSITFTKDTAAPTAPEVVLVSNDLQVTAEIGATVEYRLNGGEWIDSFTAVEGQNNVEIRQTDAAGNISEVTTQSFVRDTTPPADNLNIQLAEDTGINGDLISQNGLLNITGAETDAIIQFSLNGTDWTTTQPELASGEHTIFVRQMDQAGNPSDPQQISFTKDTTAANDLNIQLTEDTGSSSSDLITSQTELTVTGVEAGATVEYSADGLNWSVEQPQNLADGSQTIYVRQVDVAGNISEPQSIDITVDTTAPAAPSWSVINGELVVSTQENATVLYSTDNGASWQSNYIEVEGQNNLQVRYIDTAGNVSNSVGVSFVRDTIAPETPLNIQLADDSGRFNSDLITNNSQLNVSGEEAGAEIQFSLNGTDWTTTQPDLADGQHTIFVRQVDIAGNISEPQSIDITVDTTAPAAPSWSVINGELVVSTQENATVLYSTDNGASWQSNYIEVEGQNNLQVRYIDTAGNVSNSVGVSFVRDTIAPETPLNIQLADDSGRSNSDLITNNSQLNVSGEEAGAEIQFSLNGTDWTASQPQNLDDGQHTIFVRQVDAADNASIAQEITFMLDTSAPDAPEVVLVNGDLEVTAETGATVEYRLNGGEWSSSFTTVEGQNNVEVRQIDVAGNTSVSKQIDFSVVPEEPIEVSIAADPVQVGQEGTVIITFDQPVDGLTIDDIQLSNASGVSLSNLQQIGPGKFSVTISAQNIGEIEFSLPAGSVSGNGQQSNQEESFVISVRNEIIKPFFDDFSISVPTENNEPHIIYVGFNEQVSGLTKDGIIINQGRIGEVSQNGQYGFSIEFYPDQYGSGALQINFKDNAVVDSAGNGNETLAQPITRTIVGAPLQLESIDISDNGFSGFQPKIVTFTFDQKVTDFDAGDLRISNAELSNLQSDDGIVWTATITPISTENITITLDGNRIHGEQNNNNQATSETFVVSEPTQPSVIVEYPDLANGIMPFTVDLYFDKAIDLTSSQFSINGTANGSVTDLVRVSDDYYQLVITPAQVGTVTIDITDGLIANENEALNQTLEVIADSSNPEITDFYFNQTETSDYVDLLTVVFNEAVKDFTLDDLQITNAVVTSFQQSPYNQNVYIIHFDPLATGDITVTLKEGAVEDTSGNTNLEQTISTTIDSLPEGYQPPEVLERNSATFTVDYQKKQWPDEAFETDADGLVNEVVFELKEIDSNNQLAVTFHQMPDDFSLDNIRVENGVAGEPELSEISDSGIVYLIPITANGQGDIVVSLNNVVIDDQPVDATTSIAESEFPELLNNVQADDGQTNQEQSRDAQANQLPTNETDVVEPSTAENVNVVDSVSAFLLLDQLDSLVIDNLVIDSASNALDANTPLLVDMLQPQSESLDQLLSATNAVESNLSVLMTQSTGNLQAMANQAETMSGDQLQPVVNDSLQVFLSSGSTLLTELESHASAE
ncbi:Ig-like domain-containing protein [Pelagibaculum spongiae]|uniref:Ig-like domain-containing protein n=1 Tax=Pelagibaculum spongiae TaxID=2080658 RepID=A0A2V1GZP1_9GAMM|nr:Ig-like domain-containing protein [Pelagibaculum spongiae]PVZ68791.1 hypothetical protein DC094_11070 [Pelagibaculum spongiae]